MADSARIKIEGDNAPLKSALSESQTMFTEWGVAIKTAIAVQAAAIAGSLARGLVTGLKDVVGAALEADEVTERLNARIKSMGDNAAVSADKINEIADSIAAATKFDDEDLVAAQTAMLRFGNVSSDVWERATRDAADWAEAMGTDIQSQASALGRILNDPITGLRMLKEAGIAFSDEQEKVLQNLIDTNNLAAAQGMILTELEKRFQGLAEDGAKSATGQMAMFWKEMGNIQEDLGGALLPLLKDMQPALKAIADTIKSDIVPAFQSWIAGIRGVEAAQNTGGATGAEGPSFMQRMGLGIEFYRQQLEMEQAEAAFKAAEELGVADVKDSRDSSIMSPRERIENLRKKFAGTIDQLDRELNKRVDQTLPPPDIAAAEANKKYQDEVATFNAQREAEERVAQESANANSRREAGFALRARLRAQSNDFERMGGGRFEEPQVMWWEALGKAVVDATSKGVQNPGFKANIEDAIGLNRRIATAAASQSPEVVRLDQLVKQGQEAIERAQRNTEAVVKPLTELAKKTFGLG